MSAVAKRTVRVRVRRYNPDTGEPAHWQAFELPTHDKMSVLDALFDIQQGQDPTLSFRCACRVGMCGTCTTVINGTERLACRTLIEPLGDEVTVEPLRHYPVIKDLAVDMEPFFEAYAAIKPWFVPRPEQTEPAVIPPASGRRAHIDEHVECITCGACFSACTLVAEHVGFLGPAALNRSYCLTADVRDAARDERLERVAGRDGVYRCHTQFNCTEVCPKGISPTQAIQQLKRQAIGHRLKGLFKRG